MLAQSQPMLSNFPSNFFLHTLTSINENRVECLQTKFEFERPIHNTSTMMKCKYVPVILENQLNMLFLSKMTLGLWQLQS